MEFLLNEADAWALIAEKIEAGKWRGYGLCSEVHALYDTGRIAHDTTCAMLNRIDAHKAQYCEDEDGMYVFDEGEAEPRILAALVLSYEAEEDMRAADAGPLAQVTA